MNSANGNITEPYPGLRPFQQNEAALFFGRENQIDEMLSRLETHRDFRFLAVLGASGSGKSSLVRAGLLPALDQGFLLDAPAKWKFVTARPGGAPLQNLANAWIDTFYPQMSLSDEGESVRYEFASAQFRSGPLGLVRAYRGEKEAQGGGVLILIDQFEELFRFASRDQTGRSTTNSLQAKSLDENNTTDKALIAEQQRNEAAAFVELLLTAARQADVPIYIVITMRSDFLGYCDAFLGLPEAVSLSQYLTPRMTRPQLAEAIRRPLELPQFVANIDETLVNQILNDVGTDPDQLPLMQHVLMRTWCEAQKRIECKKVTTESELDINQDVFLSTENKLILDDYKNAKQLSGALSEHLNEVLESLESEQDRQIARALFICLSDKPSQGPLTRRIVKLGEVASVVNAEIDAVIRVVNVFQKEGNNFIMASPHGDLTAESELDISHETLLRQWDEAKKWLAQEAEAARQYRRLVDKVEQNVKILADIELVQALDWSRTPRTLAWAMRYDNAQTPEQSMLPACLNLIKKSKLEDEFAHKFRTVSVIFFLLLLGLFIRAQLEFDHKDMIDEYQLLHVKDKLRDKRILVFPKDSFIDIKNVIVETEERFKPIFSRSDLRGVDNAGQLAKEITRIIKKSEGDKSGKYDTLHLEKALETKIIKLHDAIIINNSNSSEQNTNPELRSKSGLGQLSRKVHDSFKKKNIEPPQPIYAFKKDSIIKDPPGLTESLEKSGIVFVSDEDIELISNEGYDLVDIYALPEMIEVVKPLFNLNNTVVKSLLEIPILSENFLKNPQILVSGHKVVHVLLFVISGLVLVWVVKIGWHWLVFEIFQSPRAISVFSFTLPLLGLILLSVGLLSFVRADRAEASILIFGVPVGTLLFLLTPVDRLVGPSWENRVKEVQVFLLRLYGSYTLIGSLWLFSENKSNWNPGLLLVDNPVALLILAFTLFILSKKKCALDKETLVLPADQSGYHRSQAFVNSQIRLYSDRAISISSFYFFGWGVPAGVMMFSNLWRVGRKRAAFIGLIVPFILYVLASGYSMILTLSEQAGEFEIVPLWITAFLITPYVSYWGWRQLSGEEIRQALKHKTALQPLWKVLFVLISVSFLGWVLFFYVFGIL